MKKKITDIWKFLTYDIWRITEDEVTRTKFSLYNIIKTIYLCINRFTKDRMANKASALTYSTLLAIVPILAILFAVARGFGFDNLMEHQFRNGFGGNIETTEAILSFVNSYLSQTKGGIFIGVGLVMLLWTVINLVSNIEITFNRIWEVKKARSMYRKITDYFSMFLLMPILIVVSGGLSLFMSTILKQMDDFVLLAPIMKFMIRLIPFVLTWLMFTGLYIFMPNTKVKFKHALIAGILAGSAYQAFQFLYINSNLPSCHRKILIAHALGQLLSHDDAICIIFLKASEQCSCTVSKKRCLAAELLYADSESSEFACCRAIRWHTLLDFENAVAATRAG